MSKKNEKQKHVMANLYNMSRNLRAGVKANIKHLPERDVRYLDKRLEEIHARIQKIREKIN